MSNLDTSIVMKIGRSFDQGQQTQLDLQQVGGNATMTVYVPTASVKDLDLGQTFTVELKANPSP